MVFNMSQKDFTRKYKFPVGDKQILLEVSISEDFRS